MRCSWRPAAETLEKMTRRVVEMVASRPRPVEWTRVATEVPLRVGQGLGALVVPADWEQLAEATGAQLAEAMGAELGESSTRQGALPPRPTGHFWDTSSPGSVWVMAFPRT